MHDARVGDSRHVPRGRHTALEVPDHFVGVGKLLGEEPAAVVGGEHTGVAPALTGQRPRVLLRDGSYVKDIDDEQVARLGALDGDRPAEHVHRRKRRVQDVLGGIVVVDGSVEPFAAVDAECVTGFDVDLSRNGPVPPIVADYLLLGEPLRGIQWKHYLRHQISLLIGFCTRSGRSTRICRPTTRYSGGSSSSCVSRRYWYCIGRERVSPATA